MRAFRFCRFAAAASAVAYALLPATASAARFPNAVEKTFAITGEAATAVARLLGMSAKGTSSVLLPLDTGTAWAVYLLKQDTKTPIYNGDGPPRWNRITFAASPHPVLTLAPYWLDLATALPNSLPGYYSFSSPFLAAAGNANDPWSLMLARLKREPGWNRTAYPQFKRCYESADSSAICVSVYASTKYTKNNVARDGYMETITVHP